MRQGDFSDLLRSSAVVTVRDGITGVPFPNNILPRTMLNPASLKWQERFYPLPNFGPPELFVANYRNTFPQQFRHDQFDARVDYQFTPKNTAYARVGYKRPEPKALDSGLPPDLTGYRVQVRNFRHVAISDTWTLTPRLINELKLGYARNYNPRAGILAGQELIDLLGIEGLPRQASDVKNIPTVSISGFQTMTQIANQAPAENTVQITDQLTFIRGRHTIKTGAEFRPQQYNNFVVPSFGSYSFTNRFSGFAYADYLLGLPQNTSRTFVRPPQTARFWFASGFVQDDFRVLPDLTLSLGLRYEYDQPAYDKYDTIANFDPRTGSLVVPGESVLRQQVNPLFPKEIPIVTAQQVGFPVRPLRRDDRNNFQPRIGFAYRPFGNTRSVLRGGYGIFNDDLTANVFSSQYGGPFGVTESFVNGIAGNASILTFTRPFLARGTLGAIDVSALSLGLRNPYVQQWNLTVEQDLGFHTGVRVSYIGTKSTNLIYGRNLNQPAASTAPFSQTRQPYPLYRTITLRENGGNHIYHALSTEVERKWERGLFFQASWTWAKNLTDIDETSGVEGGTTLENTYNRARERGNAQYNGRHRVLSNLAWELPFGRGKRFFDRPGWTNHLAGGWQLSVSYVAQTGEYFTPTFSGIDSSNTQTFGGLPDRIGNGNLPSGKRSIDKWFDTAAFVVPPNGRFGNSARGIIEGPGRQVWNLGAFKTFKVTEKGTWRLQATFTNALNHPNFDLPNLNISTPAVVGTVRAVQARDRAAPRDGFVGIRYDF